MTNSELRKKIAELKGAELRWCYTDIDGPREHQSILERREIKNTKEDDHNFKDWCIKAGRHWDIVPNWPTDISSAWQLIEEAEAKGVGYSMSDCHHSDGRITHDFAFFAPVMGPASRKYWSEAGTVPLAICEAYVKMLEGER